MKTKLLFLLAFCMPIIFFAQNGINYKAVIKDNLGNIVANDLVVVQFTILKGVAQTNVYRETHTPTTDANGIIIVNIGEGTFISGNYNTINWSNDTYYLNTQINLGSGLVDMGTTQFKTVPYALSAANVQGLEKINEGFGAGWRLIGVNPSNYGPIGLNSVDLSKSFNPSAVAGATGTNATAFGGGTIASGNTSTAMGISTTASGGYSTAMGNLTTAYGENSTTTGAVTNAFGNYSTAMGLGTIASAYGNTAIGLYNLGGGNSLTSWVEVDPLFEIGNGTSPSARSNAFTILKNGTITAPSLTNALITTAGAKALITKEYAEANLVSTGLELLNEGSGTGWRLKGRNPGAYGNIGSNAVDFSTSQNLIDIGALGTYSFAAGRDTRAQGGISTAMGTNTVASGDSSTALGAYTNATGLAATSMGYYSNATGLYSLAAGFDTRANAYMSSAIGAFNLGGGNATTWVATDPLFEIGNGTNGLRANAVTVLKNGNVGIGVSNPIAKLQTNGRIQFGNQEYIEDGGSFYITVNGSLNSTVNGVDNLGSATNRWNTVYATNGVINTSDSREKTNITALGYGLEELMRLKPVSYNWKDHPNEDKKLGLIAQELLQIIPEVVKTHEQIAIDDNDRTKTKSVEMERMGVYYSDLIPVLIKAIQEQQVTIESLKARIELLEND